MLKMRFGYFWKFAEAYKKFQRTKNVFAEQ